MNLNDFFEIIKRSKTIPGGKYNIACKLFASSEIDYSEDSIRSKLKGRRTQHCKEKRINTIIDELGFVSFFEQHTDLSWRDLQAAFKNSEAAEFVDCDTTERKTFYTSLLMLFYRLIQYTPIAFETNLPNRPLQYGRELEVNQLSKIFELNNYAFITGISGIGKTTFALSYAHELKEKGWKVQLVDCSECSSFKECISSLNFNGLKKGVKTDETFEKIMNILERTIGPILIVLDNCNCVNDNDFVEIIKNEKIKRDDVKFIIVGETCPSNAHKAVMSLNPLDDDSLLKLYASFRFSDYKQCEAYIQKRKDNMLKLFKLVDNHTLAVVLLAELAANNLLSESEIYNDISETLCFHTGDNLCNSELGSEHIKEIIRMLFDLSKMDSEEKLIMTYMSIMPLSGVSGRLFLKLTGCRREKLVKLKKYSMIIEEDNFRIRLHPLICDTILNTDELSPTEEKVEKILKKVSEYKDNIGKKTYSFQGENISDEDIISLYQIYNCIGSRVIFHTIAENHQNILRYLKPEYKNALLHLNLNMAYYGNADFSGLPFSSFKPIKDINNSTDEDDENNS